MESIAALICYMRRHVFLNVLSKKNYITIVILVILGLWSLKHFIDNKRSLARLREDKKCWKDHMLTVRNAVISFSNVQKDYIPSDIKFGPQGYPPSVPKDFLIEESDYCARKPFLKAIAFVHSAINRIDKRNFTRQTWAKFSDKLGVVFCVGKAKNESEENVVKEESLLYHDVVQGHYTDMYQLLTYKGLNGLFWVTKNCEKVPWVIHADDDILLDVNQLFNFLNKLEKEKTHEEIYGLVFKRSIVKRDAKWKVDIDEFPCATYPYYCAGPAWFTSMKVIKLLLSQVPHVKYLWVDDVYVTGLLAEKANIKRIDVNMVDSYFKESHLGKTIAWLNVLTNRTLNWESLLSYYKNNKKL